MRMVRRNVRHRAATAVTAALALMLAAAACAPSFKRPDVDFSGVRVGAVGLEGGALDVVLNVYNPNGYALELKQLTYTLLVNDSVQVGEGETNTRVRVGSRDSARVVLPVDVQWAGLEAAGRQAVEGTGVVPYRVRGDVTVGTPIGTFTRPYDERGEFSPLSGEVKNR